MYHKTCTTLNKIAEASLAVAIVLQVICVFCQVLFRFVLKLPLFWTEEAARYLMVYTVFIGCSVGIYRDAHSGFSYLLEKAPKKLQLAMKMTSYIGMLALNVYIAYYGLNIVTRNTFQVTPALQVPMWIIYCMRPLSGVLCSLQIIAKMLDLLRSNDVPAEEGGADL